MMQFVAFSNENQVNESTEIDIVIFYLPSYFQIECLVKNLLDSDHGVKRKSEHKYFATVSRQSFTG